MQQYFLIIELFEILVHEKSQKKHENLHENYLISRGSKVLNH